MTQILGCGASDCTCKLHNVLFAKPVLQCAVRKPTQLLHSRLHVLLLCLCLTGMATPHVTGAVALYAAAYKRATGVNPTAEAIKAAVMNTGTASSTYTVCSYQVQGVLWWLSLWVEPAFWVMLLHC